MTDFTQDQLQHLLRYALRAAKEAGTLVHERRLSDESFSIDFKEKGVNNIVTEMDTAAEQLIKQILSESDIPAVFLGEETGGNYDLDQLTWVVDPIDGTVNYAHNIPVYCVSIAAVYRNEPIVGVIYNPNLEELFMAVIGQGAFVNGKKLIVSKTSELKHSVLVTGFPYNIADNPHGAIDAFEDFLRMGISVRRLGSAALDLAYVAAGRFDGFWEVELNPWDVAAGILLVSEAGGTVGTYAASTPETSSTDRSQPPSKIIIDRILSTNGILHQELLDILIRRQHSQG